MLEFESMKTFLLKDMLLIGEEKVFVMSKIKNTVLWTYVIIDLNGEEIIETFYEKGLQKANQKEFRIEKVIKEKEDKIYMSNGKAMIIIQIIMQQNQI